MSASAFFTGFGRYSVKNTFVGEGVLTSTVFAIKIQFSYNLITYRTAYVKIKGAVSCDFQRCGILTSVDSDEPVHTHMKLRNSKCSVSNLTVIEYSSDKQRL